MKTDTISFRATERERIKLAQLSKQTGQSMSEILRLLVASADVRPVTTFQVRSNAYGKVLEQ